MFKRILLNISANLFGQLSTVLIQLIGVPIFLNFWGKSMYGEWLILMSFPFYLALAGSGIGNVAGNKMHMLIVSKKVSSGLQVFHSAWFATTIISIFAFLLTSILTNYLPITKFLNINLISPSDGRIIINTLLFYIIICLQSDLLLSVYRSNEKLSRGVYINTTIRLIESILVLVCVSLKFNIILVASSYVIVRLAGLAFMVYDIKKVEWFSMKIKSLNFSLLRAEIVPIISFMAFPLASSLLLQGVTILVGIKIGSIAVVSFSIMRTIINSVRQFNSILFYSLWPEVSNSIARNDFGSAKDLHRYGFQLTLILYLLFSITFVFTGDDIIQIWTGGKIEIERTFFILMLVAALPNNLWTISSVIQLSINKHTQLAIFYIFASIVSFLLLFFSIEYFGILAIPICLLLTDGSMLWFTLRQSLNIVEDNITDFSIGLISKYQILKVIRKI